MLHRSPAHDSTTLSEQAVHDISKALIPLLSDVFALYLKTKNFHWHMSGPHFRDYHLMLDDQGGQLFAMTDAIAERARKLGAQRSLHRADFAFSAHRRHDAEYVKPLDMIAELRDDNATLTQNMRDVHRYVTRRAMGPPPACWRTGLTSPRGESGSLFPSAAGISEAKPRDEPRKAVLINLSTGKKLRCSPFALGPRVKRQGLPRSALRDFTPKPNFVPAGHD